MKQYQPREGPPVIWDPKTFKLSQSTMKKFREYTRGLHCGIIFSEETLLRKIEEVSGAPQKKGHYFEYKATGELPPYGDGKTPPKPEYYKKATSTKDGSRSFRKGDLKLDWMIPDDQAENFLKYSKEIGISIVGSGVRMEKGVASGNLDIIAQVPKEKWNEVVGQYWVTELSGDRLEKDPNAPKWESCTWTDPETGETFFGCIVIDLKFSGLLDDKWNPLSWELEHLSERESHVIQAKHYHYLSENLPFFFWVFSSGEDKDSRLIRIKFAPMAIAQHEKEIIKTRTRILSEARLGFKPRPSIKRCGNCIYRDVCKHRSLRPRIDVAYFS